MAPTRPSPNGGAVDIEVGAASLAEATAAVGELHPHRSPASAPVHHTGRLSMAWKESERRTWAQSGPNVRDWASQNARLIGGGYFIHARLRPRDRSPPIWGSRGREFKSRQPDKRSPLSQAHRPFRSRSISAAHSLLCVHCACNQVVQFRFMLDHRVPVAA